MELGLLQGRHRTIQFRFFALMADLALPGLDGLSRAQKLSYSYSPVRAQHREISALSAPFRFPGRRVLLALKAHSARPQVHL